VNIKKIIFGYCFIFLLSGNCAVSAAENQRISHYVSTRSLEEKIGQLFMVTAVTNEAINEAIVARKPYRMDKEYIEELIAKYKIGGVIWLGNSTPDDQIKRTTDYNAANACNAIPLWFGQDLEPSFMPRFGLAVLPSAAILGGTDDLVLTKKIGSCIGKFACTLGVQLVFAPVADLHLNNKSPITHQRAFGGNPQKVAHHAQALAEGIRSMNIMPCFKYFPGHGDTVADSHLTLPIIPLSKSQLAPSIFPFEYAIQNGAAAIMIGHLLIPALDTVFPASLSKTIVQELLRNEMGFKGLVVTDALDMHALNNFKDCCLLALQAGCDLLLCPSDIECAIAAIKMP
jgi:beta-N-acetylhexosaminidase